MELSVFWPTMVHTILSQNTSGAMKTLLLIFLFLLFLLLFSLVRDFKISQTGEFVKSTNKNSGEWKVIGRVEILNGRIVSVMKNFTSS